MSTETKHAFPAPIAIIFNAFVDASNNAGLLFESVEAAVGLDANGREGLWLDVTTSLGLTDEDAARIWGDVARKHLISINFNKRAEPSALEKELRRVSETVLEVHEGFRLTKI